MFAAGMAAAMAVALSMPSALQARDAANPRSEMGPGMMNGNGQMSQMMDHCNQMMQGTSGRPNEQWRDDSPPAGGQTKKTQ
jgi:Spy/CpxP family protein refolding chaperone